MVGIKTPPSAQDQAALFDLVRYTCALLHPFQEQWPLNNKIPLK
jgi:hypothetical protein